MKERKERGGKSRSQDQPDIPPSAGTKRTTTMEIVLETGPDRENRWKTAQICSSMNRTTRKLEQDTAQQRSLKDTAQ